MTKTKKGSVKGTVKSPNISTDGIDIDLWTLNVLFPEKDAKPRKEKVSISIWDFGGQGKFLSSFFLLNLLKKNQIEIYYTSHQFFLSERSIFILVFDLRYDEENSRVVRIGPKYLQCLSF